jgi:hypothetical protein
MLEGLDEMQWSNTYSYPESADIKEEIYEEPQGWRDMVLFYC